MEMTSKTLQIRDFMVHLRCDFLYVEGYDDLALRFSRVQVKMHVQCS
ncbi:hypothetical protein Hdeb2414_s0006g00224311 [Helianthus debilis subsp. tardiflorus]